MGDTPGLQVKVEGDVQREVLDRIGAAVRSAVREEVAKVDLLKGYTEDHAALKNLGQGTSGLVYIPPKGSPHGTRPDAS